MQITPDKVSVQYIARLLEIRPVRITDKVQKLGLSVQDGYMSVEEAVLLVSTYVQNNKVSVSTKERAEHLLEKLKRGDVPVPKPNVQKPKRGRRKTASNTRKTSVKHPPNRLFSYVKRTIIEFIQLGVQALESTQFKFVALLIAIGVQMQHSAAWYARILPDDTESRYAAYGYAFMVDLFILVVTMEGQMNIAKTFAVLTFCSNVLYFQFWIGFDGSAQAYTNAVSSLLISGVVAYVIYGYSEMFVGGDDQADQITKV